MATRITAADTQTVLSGSIAKRLDQSPDGTLWLLIVTGSTGRMLSSKDRGSTWTVSPGAGLNTGQTSDAKPSLFIDADGYAHVVWARWRADPQDVQYARGRPTSGGGWSWTITTIPTASGRVSVDADVVAFRSGTGWSVWATWNVTSTAAAGTWVTRMTVSASGAVTVNSVTHGPPDGQFSGNIGSLEFSHTGDGKTPTATPHIYLTTARKATSDAPLYAHRARYESPGVWTWETAVQVAASAMLARSTLVSVYDGAKLMALWANSTGTALLMSEWDTATTITARNPPARAGAGGTITALAAAVDPVTDDVFVAACWTDDQDIYWTRLTRSTNTWSAWAAWQTRPTWNGWGSVDAVVQMARHPNRDSVDVVWVDPDTATTTNKFTVWYRQLLALVRAPSAPRLLSPPNGARLDLAAGATFYWEHTPVGPGDTQQAWQFQRTAGATVTYWNAATQSWSSSVVWNTSALVDPEQVTFPAGAWVTGTTYSWKVATRSSTGANSPLSAARTVVATAAPVVTVLGPAGLHYGESTPQVDWFYSSTDTQVSYEVRIVPVTGTIDPADPGPAVWTSGVVSSAIARSVRVGVDLDDATSFRAYVRATGSGGTSSAWAYSEFSLSLLPPDGPLVQVVDEVDYLSGLPRARLEVSAQSNQMDAAMAMGDGWFLYSASGTVQPEPADVPTGVEAGLAITAVAAGNVAAISWPGLPPEAPFGEVQPLGPLNFPVVDGQTYTFLGHFMAGSTVRAARLRIIWLGVDDATVDDATATVGNSVGDQVNTSTTIYVQAHVTASAPAGAKRARLVAEVLNMGAGEVHHFTRASFHPGSALSWQPGGYADTQTVRVERSDDDGATWEVVVERVRPDAYQQALVYDRALPFGQDVLYRGFTSVDLGGGGALTSAAGIVSTFRLDSDAWAIRDLEDLEAEVVAFVTAHPHGDEDAASVTQPAGREFGVVDTEGPLGQRGSLTIYVPEERREATIALLRRSVPLAVQSPSGLVMCVHFLKRDYTPEFGGAREIVADYVRVS
jgi:hypothetical protein